MGMLNYIGIYLYCINSKETQIKSRVAHSVEHRTTNLKFVGSSLTVGKDFSFCILSLSTRPW